MTRGRGQWLLGGLVALLLIAVVTVVPSLMVSSADPLTAAERLKAENDVRTALLQGLGALFLAAGLFFTARAFDLNRQGQITERFTKSVDQLGSQDAIDVRIGGIFALQRIAKESSVDRLAIIEILTAFVRHRSPWPPEQGRRKVPIDVQSAVMVLGTVAELQRTWDGEPWRVDLSGVDLRGGMFDILNLPWADLRGTHFEGATLRYAHLDHCNLHRASFKDAKFGIVVLDKARYSLETTEWPAYFNPEKAGALAMKDEVELQASADEAVRSVRAGQTARKGRRAKPEGS